MDASTTPKTSSYSDAAQEFIQVIRQHSPLAAACLEQIRADYGTRAAYLAAFALVQLKNYQTATRYTPSQRDAHAFTYCDEMGETADAIRLYDEAAAHLLPGIDRADAAAGQ